MTASTFKAAASTNLAMPSQSLIKRLCYPDAFKFSTEATRYRLDTSIIYMYSISLFFCRWGCTHESDGIKCYTKMVEEHDDGATVSKAGLVIDAVRPYIGVSPDWVSFGTERSL